MGRSHCGFINHGSPPRSTTRQGGKPTKEDLEAHKQPWKSPSSERRAALKRRRDEAQNNDGLDGLYRLKDLVISESNDVAVDKSEEVHDVSHDTASPKRPASCCCYKEKRDAIIRRCHSYEEKREAIVRRREKVRKQNSLNGLKNVAVNNNSNAPAPDADMMSNLNESTIQTPPITQDINQSSPAHSSTTSLNQNNQDSESDLEENGIIVHTPLFTHAPAKTEDFFAAIPSKWCVRWR